MASIKRLVTVFCDASFDQELRGGWAVWAKCEGITRRWSGPIRYKCNNPEEAEFCAAANAIFLVTRHFEVTESDTILIESDCMAVIRALEVGKIGRDMRQELWKSIQGIIHASPARIIPRHVKAHMKHNESQPRHAVNKWVDRAANAMRRSLPLSSTDTEEIKAEDVK